MQPPAEMPLIHGSTTPSPNEVATAASTASPPASRIAAPTCAARLCCEATTPRRVGTTRLRTICESEKLSPRPSLTSGCVRLGVGGDLGVGSEPCAFLRPDVADQLVEDPHARAVAADVRMHRQLKHAAFAPGGVEFAAEDV